MNSALTCAYADTEDERATPLASQDIDPLQAATGDTDRQRTSSHGPATFAIVYPLNRLGNQELRKPILVSVEWDDSEYVMSSSKLRIWGAGPDIYSALNDFTRTFNNVFTSYAETPAEGLTDGAVAYLEELQSYLV
jgi:hypothetical protein